MRNPPKPVKSGQYMRLRPTIQGKTYPLHLGQWADSGPLYDLGVNIGQIIYSDYQQGNFDPSLEKYKALINPAQPEIVTKESIISSLIKDIKNRPTINTIRANVIAKLKEYPKPIGCQKQAQAFYDYLLSKLKVSTANQYLSRLASICPEYFKPIKPKSETHNEPEALTRNELRLILDAIKDTYYDNLLQLLILLGTRPNELLALQWSDVHLEENYIIIRHSLDKKRNIKSTKNGKIRKIPLQPKALEILTKLCHQKSDQNSFVFLNKHGNPVNLASLRTTFYYHLNRANLSKSVLYKFRHTFISACFEAGHNPIAIARISGNTPQILYRNYASVISPINLDSLQLI